MKLDSLKKLLSLGEGQSLELKSSYRPDIAGKEVCAFLNSGGGYLVFGVEERNKITGLHLPANIKKLEFDLAENICPQAQVSFETHLAEGKQVLVIEVPAGKDIPYAFRNDVYIRIGNAARKADIATIRDMVIRRQAEPERWERRFSDARIETDLDGEHLFDVAAGIQKYGRFRFDDLGNSLAILNELSLAKYGRLTNAGDVLFCRNTSQRYPQVRIRAARFSEAKTDNAYLDFQGFEGPVLRVLEDVFVFISRNTPTHAYFPKDRLGREEAPLYPAEAIREGLVNAFVHRDYSDFSGGIAVSIYPRRIEIWNSGELPEGVTVEKLNVGHISVLRNPDLSHVLYLYGRMEKMGRGSLLIQKSCVERGLPKPIWKSEKGSGVTLTIFAPEAAPEVTPEVTPEVSPEVKRLVKSMRGEMLRREIQDLLGLKDPDHFREAYIHPALKAGVIELTIPQSPRSPKQKYRLTSLGQKWAQSKKP